MSFHIIGISEGKVNWPHPDFGEEYGDGIYVWHGSPETGIFKFNVPVMVRWAIEREIKKEGGHLLGFKFVSRGIWFVRWATRGTTYKAVALRR